MSLRCLSLIQVFGQYKYVMEIEQSVSPTHLLPIESLAATATATAMEVMNDVS
jgi:hypothetical protein